MIIELATQVFDESRMQGYGTEIAFNNDRDKGGNAAVWMRQAMDSFSPEFSMYWLRESTETGERTGTHGAMSAEGLSPSQQVALEALAELVNAARSVV